ncbi:MAG: zinc ribbon domain-containing protein [Candidatus Coprovivens sp.]
MRITTIIILVLILLIIISSVCVYFFFKEKITRLSMKVFGTKDIMEGFKNQELEYQNTPKSVSSLDSVLKPRIIKDFPTINIEELKSIVENTITLLYKSIEENKLRETTNITYNLKTKIQSIIEKYNKNNIKISNMRIHQTVINSYNNRNGSCTITFQTSLEYIKEEKKNRIKVQERLNTDLIYIYDEEEIKDTYGVSLNCPNCGAPIKNLGTKFCSYCGTGIIENNQKVWKINDIYKK